MAGSSLIGLLNDCCWSLPTLQALLFISLPPRSRSFSDYVTISTTPRELWSGPGEPRWERERERERERGRAGEGERDPGGKTNSLGGTYLSSLSSGNKNELGCWSVDVLLRSRARRSCNGSSRRDLGNNSAFLHSVIIEGLKPLPSFCRQTECWRCRK